MRKDSATDIKVTVVLPMRKTESGGKRRMDSTKNSDGGGEFLEARLTAHMLQSSVSAPSPRTSAGRSTRESHVE